MNRFLFILLQFLILTYSALPVLADCEQRDFGSSNIQYYIYSDGRTWNFTASQNMNVTNIETLSRLAGSGTYTLTIEVLINGEQRASWGQNVTTSYTNYTHSQNVSFYLNLGDTITYKISGGTLGTPGGAITGPNYVKLCDDEPCVPPNITTFTGTPETIQLGQESTLNWSIADADSANIDQGIGSANPVSGSINVSPQSTTVYTLTASNDCGTRNSSVTVSVLRSNQGLVAEYLFNGNADDTSGNGLDGNVVGAKLTADRFGRENSAYLFDGLNDLIRLPSSNVFYSSGGFTWAVWVKPNNDGGAAISAGDTIGCEDFQLGLGEHPGGLPAIDNNAVWATVDNVGGCSARNILDYVIPGGIVNNQFYHLALRVDYQGQLADLFLNGIKVQSVNISGSINSRNMMMTIGAFRDTNDNPWLLFDGVLDDVYFYDRVLSETEIRNLFNGASLNSIPLSSVYNLLLNNNE